MERRAPSSGVAREARNAGAGCKTNSWSPPNASTLRFASLRVAVRTRRPPLHKLLELAFRWNLIRAHASRLNLFFDVVFMFHRRAGYSQQDSDSSTVG